MAHFNKIFHLTFPVQVRDDQTNSLSINEFQGLSSRKKILQYMHYFGALFVSIYRDGSFRLLGFSPEQIKLLRVQ